MQRQIILGDRKLCIHLELKWCKLTEQEKAERAKMKLLHTDAGLTEAILALFPNMRCYLK